MPQLRRLRGLLLVALVGAGAGVAHAEGRLDAHVGGGIEAGLIAASPHPTAVAEVGLGASWMLPGRSWGPGLALGSVARPGADLAASEEDTFDLMVRFSRRDRRFHGGVGAGLRWRSPAPVDGMPAPGIHGVDFVRFDVSGRFGVLDVGGARASVDGYFAWTFGCYLGYASPVERPDLWKPVSCGDTLTSTYVVGLQLALAGR